MVLKRLESRVLGGHVGFAVLVDGVPLSIHEHEGKYYCPAPLGKEYELELFVPVFGRYLFVGSIDGLDIMTGKTQTNNGGGYVVSHPLTSDENKIPGFRLDDKRVARFQFLSAEEGGAALIGQPENIGVIAFEIYSELCFRGSERSRTLGHDVGTGMQRIADHEVESTSFRAEELVAKFVLEYASPASLMEAGIIKPSSPLGNVEPFPAARSTPVASIDEIEKEKALAVLNSMWVKIPESEREQKNQELRELLIRWQAEDINERYKDSP